MSITTAKKIVSERYLMRFYTRVILAMIAGFFTFLFSVQIHTFYNELRTFKKQIPTQVNINHKNYQLPTYESDLIPFSITKKNQILRFRLRHDDPNSVKEFVPMNAFFQIYKNDQLLLTFKRLLKNPYYEVPMDWNPRKYCNLCAAGRFTFPETGQYYLKITLVSSKPIDFPIRVRVQENLGSTLFLFLFGLITLCMSFVNYRKILEVNDETFLENRPKKRYTLASTMLLATILLGLIVFNFRGAGNIGYDGLSASRTGSVKSTIYGQYWYGKDGLTAAMDIDQIVLDNVK